MNERDKIMIASLMVLIFLLICVGILTTIQTEKVNDLIELLNTSGCQAYINNLYGTQYALNISIS